MPFSDFSEDILKNKNSHFPELVQKFYDRKGIQLPVNWLYDKAINGKCFVIMDGLDEVADNNTRQEIVDWLQNQIITFQKSDFIISSRPGGYFDNPLLGVDVFEIKRLL